MFELNAVLQTDLFSVFPEYGANEIKVDRSRQDIYKIAEELAEQYCKPVEFIRRALESYALANRPFDHFVRKYLENEDLPAYEDVQAIHRENR